MPKNNVAATLSRNDETQIFESAHNLRTGYARAG